MKKYICLLLIALLSCNNRSSVSDSSKILPDPPETVDSSTDSKIETADPQFSDVQTSDTQVSDFEKSIRAAPQVGNALITAIENSTVENFINKYYSNNYKRTISLEGELELFEPLVGPIEESSIQNSMINGQIKLTLLLKKGGEQYRIEISLEPDNPSKVNDLKLSKN